MARNTLVCAALTGLLSNAALSADASTSVDPVAVLVPVTYSNEAPVKPRVKNDCNLEQTVATDLSSALGAKSLGGATTTDQTKGNVLKVTIERVISASGGGWTGNKTLSLSIQLLSDGQVQRSTSRSVATKSLNPLASTCSSLERASGKLGVLIAKWLTENSAASLKGQRDSAAESLTSVTASSAVGD